MIYEVEFLDNFLEVFFSNNGLFCYLRFAKICIGHLNFSIIALEPFYPQKIIFSWDRIGARSNFQKIQKEFCPIVYFDPSFTRVS